MSPQSIIIAFFLLVTSSLTSMASSCAGYTYVKSLVAVRSINGLSVEAHSIIGGPPPNHFNPCSFWTRAKTESPSHRSSTVESCPSPPGGDLCTLDDWVQAVSVLDINSEAGTYTATAQFATFDDRVPPGIWTYPANLSASFTTACADFDKDSLLYEYTSGDYQNTYIPGCGNFVINVTTAHFTYSELNSGDYQHAIFAGSLTAGVECVRSQNGDAPLSINSAYRNPARNAEVGISPDSRHIHGDAVDFSAPSGNPLREHSTDIRNSCGACREPLADTPTWVHFDWRGTCPPLW
jgi:hypothetical protein